MHNYLLLFLILLGAALRLAGIEHNSLWYDELFSVYTSDPSKGLLQVISETMRDVHPPLYQSLLWCWYKIFGFGEFSGRYLSAVLGIIHIPAMYVLGKKLFNERVGLIATFLLTINFFYIWFSQETRSYELLSLLTTMSFILFLDTQEGKKYSFFFYAVTLIALVNTHFFGFLPAFAQAILILISRKFILRYILIAVSVVISLIPLIGAILANVQRKTFWITEPPAHFFYKYFRDYFGEALLAHLMFLLVLLAFIKLYRAKDKKRLLIFALWVICCTFLPYLKSIISTPILTYRNTIVALPAYLLLVAFIVGEIKSKKIVTGFFVLVSGLSLYYFVLHQKLYLNSNLKQNWREVTQLVIEDDKNHRIPLFSTKPKEFQIYFKVLGSGLQVAEVTSLKQLSELEVQSFQLLQGHDKFFSKKEIEENTGFRMVRGDEFKKVSRMIFEKVE